MNCCATIGSVGAFGPICLREAIKLSPALSYIRRLCPIIDVRRGEPAARPYSAFFYPQLSYSDLIADKP